MPRARARVCVYVCVCVCLYVCVSKFLSVWEPRMSVSLYCVCLSTCLRAYLPVSLTSTCLSINLAACLFVYQSASWSVGH